MKYLLKKVDIKILSNFLGMKHTSFINQCDALCQVKYSLNPTNKASQQKETKQIKVENKGLSKGKLKGFTDQIEMLCGLRYGFSSKKVQSQAPTKNNTSNKNDKNELQVPQKASNNFQIKTPKGTRDFKPEQMAIRRKVIDSIVDVFRRHGAVEIDTPVFQLRQVLTGKYGQDSKLIYNLEDQGGQICSLRYDLTVPFARFMANYKEYEKIKRFHIGKVYRRDQPTANKGRFREFYQCDFDIAGKYDSMIPDSQVISIMQQILETVGVNQFLVKINHRKILQMMIRQAGCDLQKFKPICSSIDKLDKMQWAEVKDQLVKTKGVTEEQAQIIGKLTCFKGNPFQLLQRIINQNIFTKTKNQIQPYLQQMRKLFKYLQAMNRIAKVSFDLSLARGLDYYTGIIYEIVLTDKTTELGSISGGGRYDDLIGMFRKTQIPSVGGSIGIQRIFNILQEKYRNKVKQNPCEVLVGTIQKVPVQQKLKILSKLWQKNIKAETLYLQKAKADKQFDHAFDNKIPMILWVAEDELKSGQLNLKILYKKEQVKVSLESIGEAVLPYVEQFRRDYEEGRVVFQEPKKK